MNSRYRRKTAIIILSIIALGTSPAFAGERRLARAVVLLDFAKPSAPPAVAEGTEPSIMPQDLDAISRVMASQFTGARIATADVDQQRAVSPKTSSTSAWGNPFTLYAISPLPVYYAPARETSPCAMPIYRPSSGFGRAAEGRRRILFPLVHRAACEVGLPVGLFDAVIMQESRYKPAAVSTAGAFGLAQLMPGTAQQLGVDRYSLKENLRGGARYLKEHVNRFGRYDLALAAYNAGPARVAHSWQVPHIPETQNYVRAIIANWTGVASVPSAAISPSAGSLSYRRAQIVFMPAPDGFSGRSVSLQRSTPTG